MDTDYCNAVGPFYSNSLTILSTVISQQGPRAVTIDSGLKSLSTDSGFAECKDPRYTYKPLGGEHGGLYWEENDGKTLGLEIGDRVEMIPSQIDPTINLHDHYYAYESSRRSRQPTLEARFNKTDEQNSICVCSIMSNNNFDL